MSEEEERGGVRCEAERGGCQGEFGRRSDWVLTVNCTFPSTCDKLVSRSFSVGRGSNEMEQLVLSEGALLKNVYVQGRKEGGDIDLRDTDERCVPTLEDVNGAEAGIFSCFCECAKMLRRRRREEFQSRKEKKLYTPEGPREQASGEI